MKYILIIVVIVFQINNLVAQDTTTVQAFDYLSATRDSLIDFPLGDHNQYEKIIMSYNMRCKNGLVSTTSDRNKGCGEWDYSCNTSIIDSTIVDSLLSYHPDHIIVGHNLPYLNYVTNPVYSYYLRDLSKVSLNSLANEKSFAFNNADETMPSVFDQMTSQKSIYLITADKLVDNTSNSIGAISFDLISNIGDVDFLSVKIGTTAEATINQSHIDMPLETVFYDHVSSNLLLNDKLILTKDFTYDQGDNVIIEITYTNKNTPTTSKSNGVISNDMSVISKTADDYYVDFSNTKLTVPTDGLQDIKDEITIAMWVKGDINSLPKNTTIIEGTDDNNLRQINIHLPWSNSNIFWDCGNDGTGYDRINMAADKNSFAGDWNHWAFTKNVNTGNMSIYLNGALWQSRDGFTRPITIKNLSIGSSVSGSNFYDGGIDDVLILNKALSSDQIQNLSRFRPSSDDTYSSNIKLHYDFNNIVDNSIIDHSPNSGTGLFNGKVREVIFRGNEIFKDFVKLKEVPNLILHSGDYNRSILTQTVLDSIENFPFEIQPFRVVGTDLVQDPSLYYWQAGYTPIYKEDGTVVDSVEIELEEIVYVGEIEYYRKFPSKFELLSFVTPYGINLDFGLEGKTWLFDVTDFGPILKGKKRLLMDRGGQWQEQMDIKFHFIKGTPSRNVYKIHQVWPPSSTSNSNIVSNNLFEKRTIPVEDNVQSAKLRVAITGHGQEGEFIPRTHFVNLNGGSNEYSWQAWKECGFNPVYPQGGTWVYDRAGWCPGAPTDLNQHEIMEHINGADEFTIDYGMEFASGDSRYIVNTQVVKYGAPNFTLDASIEEIISPTMYVEHDRLNPTCAKPTVRIKNNGSTPLTSLWIAYGVVGTESISYQWKGNLAFLESEVVELPSFSEGRWSRGNEFEVSIKLPNQGNDEYSNNNRLTSNFETTPHLNGNVIINLITNGAPNETRWHLRDENGEVIASRTNGMSAFTEYSDTITNLDGCYTLQFSDTDQDGISWWANNDGNGFIRVREEGEAWTSLQRDFGAEITYAFTAGTITKVEDINPMTKINVFPNPSRGIFNIELSGLSEAQIQVYNQTGALIQKINHKGNNKYDEVVVNIEDEVDGLYILVVIDKYGHRLTKKIIKGH